MRIELNPKTLARRIGGWTVAVLLAAAPVAVSPWFVMFLPLAAPLFALPVAIVTYRRSRSKSATVSASIGDALLISFLFITTSMPIGVMLGAVLADALGHEAHFR